MTAPHLSRQTVPLLRCTAKCPVCENPTDEYPLFGCGLGGDFDTWQNTESGDLYRVDLLMVMYGHTTLEACLELLAAHAGGRDKLRHLPEEVFCNSCAKRFHAKSGHIEREEKIEVYICTMQDAHP
jgi:hypothetical protein